MPTPDGPQWVNVYRGLAYTDPEKLDKGGLGRHWSTNRWVAESFATDGLEDTDSSVVLEAKVHKKNIIPEGTEEWDNEAGRYGAEGQASPEREHTVRRGAPVHIMSVTHYFDNTKSETKHRKDMSFGELRKYRA